MKLSNNNYPCVAGIDEYIDLQALQGDLELPCYIELGDYSIVYDTRNHLEINIPDSHFLSNRDLSSMLMYVVQVCEK